MSDHSTALVPLESWCYNSPEVFCAGSDIDIGLLAEALIYYDRVFINVTNQNQFSNFLAWFVKQGKFADLLNLIKENVIRIYEYSFVIGPVFKENVVSILNIQDETQAKPNTFEQRYLYHSSIKDVLKHSYQRDRLFGVLRDKITEVKAREFGKPIKNAQADYSNPQRAARLLQCF